MHFLRQLLQSTLRSPPSISRYHKLASAGAKTSGIAAMAAYACTVSLRPGPVSDKTLDRNNKDHHVKNSRGETVKFQNPYPSHIHPSFSGLASTVFKGLFGSSMPKPKLADNLVPVVKPEFLPERTASDELRATWLGHACYYVEYPSGLRVLFDPVFEDCCSPVPLPSLKRYSKQPCAIGDIPFVDAVVISHSHYDHLSYPSVQEIKKHHPNVHFFVGLGLEKWFRASGVENVTEMDWWDEADVTFTPEARQGGDAKALEPIKARISCLPSQHHSGRTAFDKDCTLWASWAVKSGTAEKPEKTVWFGGDTGYRTVPQVAEGIDDWGAEFQKLPVCPQFQQIGEHLGSIDLGLIPIGAYSPRHIFSHMHANPFDSVEIFLDTKCKKAMGIHWGTWVLTYEHPLEPPKLLKEALRRRGMPETGVFDVCDIGESRTF
ncbi:Metallo-hydrolase/oxidoreductase [Xylariaceae sp. FL0594]|nr:Metallo-hydrolase/oxidoreductase [Xylariaceae sp. FL0594]